MSIDTISKSHLNNLLVKLNSTDLEQYKHIQKIKSNNIAYAKLKMLANQIKALEDEARTIINETIEIDDLNNVKCSFKKYPGNYYYLYENIHGYDNNLTNELEINNEKFLSILSPEEWKYDTTKIQYIPSDFYDYDLTFIKQ